MRDMYEGVWRGSSAEILLGLVSNQIPRETQVGRPAGGGITIVMSTVSTEAQSVRARFGERGVRRKKGASKGSRMGMWSEPQDCKGSDHSEKGGARRGQAKAQWITPRLPTKDWEKGV